MEKPGSLRALLECRCPSCRTGKVFTAGAYNLISFHKMPLNCPDCGRSFQPEPGFYFGAMYVSYAFTVAITTAVWLFLYVLIKPPEYVYILAMLGGVIGFAPLSFRYSRMIWLYWFG